ncbi:Crp/Fnr family transcriptional regulator [Rhodococcus sp. LB1]|uniref:Crp/Fnr family transcriptional regulator n=1 Tax=Rhodococcus sp. LB1 TaxID=1807499 RepID=UPI00077A6A26|nr:Crp/Fnr family transcriptional regulator [Rhodococcus sp. LB1]KXX54203.1 hypothetical protein AZG88_25085 [Rhodococcus sp. LB1]
MSISDLRTETGISAAWADSAYADVSEESKAILLETATVHVLESAELIPLSSTCTGTAGLVIDGLLRVYVTSGQRQVTLQYATTGQEFGIPQLKPGTSNQGLTAGGKALIDTSVVMFSPSTLAMQMERDRTVQDAVIRGLMHAHHLSVSLLAENVLAPLRQRVARHLLDMAVKDGKHVVVPVTVQDLADATGSVREVVTRLLKTMRDNDLIRREAGRLVLQDMRRLHAVATGPADDHLL